MNCAQKFSPKNRTFRCFWGEEGKKCVFEVWRCWKWLKICNASQRELTHVNFVHTWLKLRCFIRELTHVYSC